MLGIILIYWIGKKFYTLAATYNQNKWAFAVLGVISYYGAILLAGIVTGVLLGIFAPESIDGLSEVLLGILMIPFGLLACYAFYKILENYWKDKKEKEAAFIEKIDS